VNFRPQLFPAILLQRLRSLCLKSYFIALKFYYIEFIDRNNTFVLASFQTILPLVIVFLVNYFAFLNNDKWKVYVNEFSQWPRERNLIGTWIVAGIVIFIIVNLFVAFSIMSKITGIP